jgi:hypothetical protein
MCEQVFHLTQNVTLTPVSLSFRGSSPQNYAADAAIILSAGGALQLDLSALELTNIKGIKVVNGSQDTLILLVNVTDTSRTSAVTLPAYSYHDSRGNFGALNATIQIPAVPVAYTSAVAASQAIGATTLAVTSATTLASIASGASGGANLGRSLGSLQFFAWAGSIAAPNLPKSFKDVSQALRWSATASSGSSKSTGYTEEINIQQLPVSNVGRTLLQTTDNDSEMPALLTAEDVRTTLLIFTYVLCGIVLAHAGEPP